MGHKWFGQALSSDEVKMTARQLAQLGFRDLYFHVGPLDAQGQIPPWKATRWRGTLEEFRAAIPGMRAYAWVGGVTVYGIGKAPDTIDDRLPEIRAAVIDTCKTLA
jgi:hypothetical protein